MTPDLSILLLGCALKLTVQHMYKYMLPEIQWLPDKWTFRHMEGLLGD